MIEQANTLNQELSATQKQTDKDEGLRGKSISVVPSQSDITHIMLRMLQEMQEREERREKEQRVER